MITEGKRRGMDEGRAIGIKPSVQASKREKSKVRRKEARSQWHKSKHGREDVDEVDWEEFDDTNGAEPLAPFREKWERRKE